MKLADIKRLNVGDTLTIIDCNTNNPQLNITRKISIVQTNSLAIETMYKGEIVNGWLDFPKAKNVISLNDRTFKIMLNDKLYITYQVNK